MLKGFILGHLLKSIFVLIIICLSSCAVIFIKALQILKRKEEENPPPPNRFSHFGFQEAILIQQATHITHVLGFLVSGVEIFLFLFIVI